MGPSCPPLQTNSRAEVLPRPSCCGTPSRPRWSPLSGQQQQVKTRELQLSSLPPVFEHSETQK